MKLVMTLLVRDAETIIRENIAFHLRQGVDFFIVTDNRSTDGTARIVGDYVRAGRAELIHEPRDDFSQAQWVTRMARRAATQHGADWVINNDDDEFWQPRAGSLRDTLARVPEDCHALVVQRRNHPPLRGLEAEDCLVDMIYRERRSSSIFGHPLPPKVCHRAYADIAIGQGNHAASRASGARLRVAASDMIAIAHFPIRDYAAFERKIRHGGAAYARNTTLDLSIGATWRLLYEIWREGSLRAWYDAQRLGPEDVARGLANGTLVEDRSIARAVRNARGFGA